MADSNNPLIPKRPKDREQVALPGPSVVTSPKDRIRSKRNEEARSKKSRSKHKSDDNEGSVEEAPAKSSSSRRSSRKRRKTLLKRIGLAALALVAIGMIVLLGMASREHKKAIADVDEVEQDTSGPTAAAKARGLNQGIGQPNRIEAVGEKEAELMNKASEEAETEKLEISDELMAKLEASGAGTSEAGETDEPESDTGSTPSRDMLDDATIRVLTEEEEREVAQTFDAYREITDWRHLERIVRDPERVAPMMEVYYGEMGNSLIQLASYPDLRTVMVITNNGQRVIRCEYDTKSYETRVAFLVQGDDDFWQLDWESFTHFLPIPWEELLRSRPPGVFQIRVQTAQGDLFTTGFEKNTVSCYKLNRLVEDGSLYGYTKLGSELDNELKRRIAKAGGRGSFILSVRFPKNLPESSTQVEILDIISPFWVRL